MMNSSNTKTLISIFILVLIGNSFSFVYAQSPQLGIKDITFAEIEAFNSSQKLAEIKNRLRIFKKRNLIPGQEESYDKKIKELEKELIELEKTGTSKSASHPKTIYGVDGRTMDVLGKPDKDIKTSELIKKNAKSVVALVPKKYLKCVGDVCTLNNVPLFTKLEWGGDKKQYDLCQDQEIFTEGFKEGFGQPMLAECSGFLIRKDVVVTAGHCFLYNKPDDFYYVLGYWLENGKTPTEIPAHNVFESNGDKHTEYTGEDDMSGSKTDKDFAFVKLTKPTQESNGHLFIKKFRGGGLIENKEDVYVIGHPRGLPMVYAGEAWVRRNLKMKKTFLANLDTFGGNSGSMVVNYNTHAIEGILIEGDSDFELNDNKSCLNHKVCPKESGCIGETVFRFSEILDKFDEVFP